MSTITLELNPGLFYLPAFQVPTLKQANNLLLKIVFFPVYILLVKTGILAFVLKKMDGSLNTMILKLEGFSFHIITLKPDQATQQLETLKKASPPLFKLLTRYRELSKTDKEVSDITEKLETACRLIEEIQASLELRANPESCATLDTYFVNPAEFMEGSEVWIKPSR